MSAIDRLGPPDETIKMEGGVLEMWFRKPVIATRLDGYIAEDQAREISAFFRAHFDGLEELVTVHDWHAVTDFDISCRKILHNLTTDMKSKQKEVIIYLGDTESLSKKIVKATIATIVKLKKLSIETFPKEQEFQERLDQLCGKYRVS